MIKPFFAIPVTFLRNCLDRLVRNIQRMSRQFNPYPHFYIKQSRQTRQSRQIIRQATISSYTRNSQEGNQIQDPAPSRQRQEQHRNSVQARHQKRHQLSHQGNPRVSRQNNIKPDTECLDCPSKTAKAHQSELSKEWR